MKARALLVVSVSFSTLLFAQAPASVPRIWDDAALADWATPIAGLNVRPAHYTSAEYYAIPGDNLRTYPVYHPDSEPPGYWEDLQKKKPEPIVDASGIRSPDDWIATGRRTFEQLDAWWSRTDDPADIAQARNPESFQNALKLPDGSAFGPRWVVTDRGVMLSWSACSNCHFTYRPDLTLLVGGPRGQRPAGTPGPNPRVAGAQGSPPTVLRRFVGDSMTTITWRMFTVPWAPDERIERMRNGDGFVPGQNAAGDPGVFHRPHGSPYYATKILDLHTLRYSRYMDATATHRLRGPEDVARYAAFIMGVDPMEFGPHRLLSDQQRPLRFRYADEVVYAIGAYLLSLEPPRNPAPASPDLLQRGEQLFRREGCVNCHTPPDYTSAKLTIAEGYELPANHPNKADVLALSVQTDPGLALKTRKGTGFYKIPSLRGLWYRPRLLHDGSVASLEEMFDPARLSPEHVPGGWKATGVTTRAIVGHRFGLSLNAEEKTALLAFLRSL